MTPIDVARFSTGRQYITGELDALRLFAGANSVAIGETLLTDRKDQLRRGADRCGFSLT